MRCYFVLVHGKLDWLSNATPTDEFGSKKPAGFYCHRYVLAADEGTAGKSAFRRVKDNLERQFGWLSDGLATVTLEAEEVRVAPMQKLLRRDNRGHTFYDKE